MLVLHGKHGNQVVCSKVKEGSRHITSFQNFLLLFDLKLRFFMQKKE
jgi:hypothetical protein